jgi:N-acetylglucosamine-6-sulfatase
MTTAKRRGASRPTPRRSPWRVVALMVLLGVLATGIGLGWYALRGAATPPLPTGPNVVVLVLDDLDLWTWERLPALRNLLGGRDYTNAFVTNSLCCPSRVSMLTGQYPHNHGVLSDEPPIGGFSRAVRNGVERLTVAYALQQAGYRTGLVGKYLNGYGDPDIHAEADEPLTYIPPGWDTWFATEGALAYEDYTVNDNGVLVQPTDYLTDLEADRAVDFMKAGGEAPYFLWLAPIAPHLPAHPAPRDADARVSVELPPGEEDRTDKPEFLQQLEPGRTKAQLKGLQERRLRTMKSATALVERVMAAMTEDTYLIVVSDNGLHIGQHGLPVGKSTAYEPDIHVPLVIIGPSVRDGVDDRLALNIDIAPTVAALTGVELPLEPDGVSLLARPAVERDAFVVEHEANPRYPYYNALRTADGRLYVEWEGGAVELYHLADDPAEDTNLAADPNADRLYGEEMLTLSRRLHELMTCAGADCH